MHWLKPCVCHGCCGQRSGSELSLFSVISSANLGGLWNSFRGRSSVYLLELSSSQMETDIENSSNVTTLISRRILKKLGKLGEGAPTNESLKKLDLRTEMTRERLRPCLAYAGGYKGEEEGHKVPKRTDIFISVFEPDRFLRTKESNGIEGWAGFDPSRSPGALYPNELIKLFQSLPFGGGPRKCIGEQFALMESTVALANVWNRLSLRI
ncbi:unnamed protein product [Brassica rapa subsp. trilocularis]